MQLGDFPAFFHDIQAEHLAQLFKNDTKIHKTDLNREYQMAITGKMHFFRFAICYSKMHLRRIHFIDI